MGAELSPGAEASLPELFVPPGLGCVAEANGKELIRGSGGLMESSSQPNSSKPR